MTSEDRVPPADDGEGARSSASPGVSGAPASSEASATPNPPRRRRLSVWQESLLLVAIAVVVALVVKTLFLQAFYIPSGSMEPGLQKNDRILVEKPSYWGSGPSRGDIVVFDDPGGWLSSEEDGTSPGNPVTKALAAIGLYPTGGHLVKRVIAVAGDTVHCCDDLGRIEVNGHPLDESSYARPGVIDGKTCYGPMPGICDWTAGPVPKGYIFVMGDNRGASSDSTVHLCTSLETECSNSPYVPVHDVVGKVFALAWPPGRAHFEHRPADFAGIPAPAPAPAS